MSAEIIAATGTSPSLIGGGGGVFDVEVDGTIIFSKFAVQRFPKEGEMAAHFAER